MLRKNLKTCARCKRTFGDMQIRRCANEAVNRALGDHICYYCCRQCKFHEKHPYCGAIGCGYDDKGNQVETFMY